MRGRRAFVILTLYLLFLAGFAWAWELIAERAYGNAGSLNGGSAAFASALIGQEIFGALLIVETLLVVFLAPAFTAGAISLEREKQTLDMLAATPISSLAIVIGKLLSALTYVFILIVASIPLTAMVFVFGGVGPDEVLRGYVVLFASAIGLGSLGLFISALMQRTQAATVVTFFGVMALTMGSLFIVLFWTTMAGISPNQAGFGNQGIGPIKGRPPEALLWYNPFAAQYDVICGASDGYGGWCSRLAEVTNGAISIGIGGGADGRHLDRADRRVTIPPRSGEPSRSSGDRRSAARSSSTTSSPSSRSASGATRSGRAASQPGWSCRRSSILASVQLVSPTRRWRPGSCGVHSGGPPDAVALACVAFDAGARRGRWRAPMRRSIRGSSSSGPLDPGARGIRAHLRPHRRRLWLRRIVRRAWLVGGTVVVAEAVLFAVRQDRSRSRSCRRSRSRSRSSGCSDSSCSRRGPARRSARRRSRSTPKRTLAIGSRARWPWRSAFPALAGPPDGTSDGADDPARRGPAGGALRPPSARRRRGRDPARATRSLPSARVAQPGAGRPRRDAAARSRWSSSRTRRMPRSPRPQTIRGGGEAAGRADRRDRPGPRVQGRESGRPANQARQGAARARPAAPRRSPRTSS